MPTAILLAVALAAPSVKIPSETVVMLELGTTAEAQRRERTLHDELSLVLDGFGLVSLRPDNPRFSEAPLPTQLEEVFALAQAENAVAVVWLARDAKGRLLLELVAQRTGRTLIRSIEGTKGQGERELALAVRELLATAFLFEPVERQPAPVSVLVKELKQQVAPAPEPVPEPSSPVLPFRARVELGASVGLAGEVGGVPHAVLALRGARLLGNWVELGVIGEAAGARGVLSSEAAVSWWRFSFGAIGFVRREAGRFTLGAGLSATAMLMRWSLLTVSQMTAGSGWAFRGELIGEAGYEFVPRLFVMVSGAVGLLSHRIAVSQGDQLVYVTPTALGRLSLGVEYRF